MYIGESSVDVKTEADDITECSHDDQAINGVFDSFVMMLYDTIWYDTVYLCVLKSWRDGQPNLAHGTETKKNKVSP